MSRVDKAAQMQEHTENAQDNMQTEYAGAELVLLEADTYLRDVLTFTLEDAGLQTILASPATLEAQLLENPCQWLLLNPDLPEIDAPALIHRLRHNPATASLPILLLSEQSYSETTQQAMAAGAQGHLTQPIEANTLYALLCLHTRG